MKSSNPEDWENEGQTDYKRQLAYKRLGINPQDVKRMPFFSADLRRMSRCIDQARSGRASVPIRPFDYLGFSEDPEARKVLDAYRSVPPSYRRLLPPEAFCDAAGVSPSHILEAITVVAVRLGTMASAVVAAVARPDLVSKTIERALQDDGVRERMMLLRALGFPDVERNAALAVLSGGRAPGV